MLKLIHFFVEKKSFVLFVLLELIALILVVNSHNYAHLKLYHYQTTISGWSNERLNVVNQYFNLKKENTKLLEQNTLLLKKIQDKASQQKTSLIGQFNFIPAQVISNQYTFDNNIILINKGTIDSLRPEMGVIGTHGIVGIIQNTAPHFSKVISILNKNIKINVSLKNTNYTGFLEWNYQNPNKFDVVDMPQNVKLKIGDTIVTSGISNIFPKNIPVGKITNFKKVAGLKNYKINIKTFMDMRNINNVYVVNNKYQKEIDSLLNKTHKNQ